MLTTTPIRARAASFGVVVKIAADAARVLREQDVRDRFSALGMEPVGNTPEEFAAHIDSELKKWSGVVKERGLKVD